MLTLREYLAALLPLCAWMLFAMRGVANEKSKRNHIVA
eukprot:COSAG05_NODE_3509_length_2019_cov_1.798437_3_plen_37_part_01